MGMNVRTWEVKTVSLTYREGNTLWWAGERDVAVGVLMNHGWEPFGASNNNLFFRRRIWNVRKQRLNRAMIAVELTRIANGLRLDRKADA